MMLISTVFATISARDYARFVSTLSRFTMYCVYNLGTEKDDYLSGLNTLEHYYSNLFSYEEEQPYWAKVSVGELFKKFRKILDVKHPTNQEITEAAKLLQNFETEELLKFERKYFEYQNFKIIGESYPKRLQEAVYDLMNNNQSESAIMAAFKFLDSHLQTLLGVDVNHYYGEDLMNYAFSPNSGVLQVHGHPNEQIGIRNFFSGANAIFRNPSAHRFVEYDSTTAEAIVVMVAMMAKFASRIKENMESDLK